MFILPASYEVHAPEPEIIYLDELITEASERHDAPRWVVEHIVEAESNGDALAVGDMHITCKRTGLPVRARGAGQITECYHPEVSDEQAFDLEFAVDFVARAVGEGKCEQEYSTCPL